MRLSRAPIHPTFFTRKHNAAGAAKRDELITRIAPTRNAVLCAGIPPYLASFHGVKAHPPQPHVPWPLGRGGWICLRCSASWMPPKVARPYAD